MTQTAVIIGAGPAGLTAALELLRRTHIRPVVLEASQEIGGISRTIRYKGNRMDIGGHRFFSKSDRVMQWWMDLMPPETEDANLTYRGQTRPMPVTVTTNTDESGPADEPRPEAHGHTETRVDPATVDCDLVMLIRPRKSRIYYLRRFFDYPIRLTGKTLTNLGLTRTARVGASYLYSRFHQIAPEKSLEDFLINRFGRELYLTFFKSYTEKVWGTPCHQISAEWGAQRIKGLSLTTAVKHFIRKSFPHTEKSISQKTTDTSLIERFMYPKYGPGQLWEHVAEQVVERGGEICTAHRVQQVHSSGQRITAVTTVDDLGRTKRVEGDYFFSTMPIKELVAALDCMVPANVREVAEGLEYRDFITVGLLVDRLKIHETDGTAVRDTWIYVQEPDVLLGRLQIFNNWSPYLVADPGKIWIGLEYFCYDTDPLWHMPDDQLKAFAIAELVKIGILDAGAVCDAHVVRVPKTYPAYFGTYSRFKELRTFTDSFENLFLIGRNGMHKYNNQDHSMLTAMYVVDGLAAGHVDRAALWEINTEQDYHEVKKA